MMTGVSCATILVTRKPETRTKAPPSYQSSRPLFLWGLVDGQPDVSLSDVCLGKDADQVSFSYTPLNIVETAITLGVYSPRTLRVWCQL